MTYQEPSQLHYRQLLSANMAVMSIIDSAEDAILVTSCGERRYHGYALSDLTALSISDIKFLGQNLIGDALQQALAEQMNRLVLRKCQSSERVLTEGVFIRPAQNNLQATASVDHTRIHST